MPPHAPYSSAGACYSSAVHPAIVAYAARVAWARQPLEVTPAQPEAATEMRLHGLPAASAKVRVWSTPMQVGVTILALDGTPLRHPVEVPLAAGLDAPLPLGDGRCIRTAHGDWYEVLDGGPRLEVVRLTAEGDEVYAEAPRTSTWVLSCPKCGRARYAPRRALASITSCHICTHNARRTRRAAAQRAAYTPREPRQTASALRAYAVELARAQRPLAEIAGLCARSISWASRATAHLRSTP